MSKVDDISDFLAKLPNADAVFIGGLDRSGTTKVGAIISSLGFTGIQEVSSISSHLLLSPEINSFPELVDKKGLGLEAYHSFVDLDIQDRIEKVSHFYLNIFNNKGKFVETSPNNLEMYYFLSRIGLKTLFVFLKRDINDLWCSYKKLDWGPCSFSDLTREVERKALQLSGLQDNDDVLVLSYEDISVLERGLAKAGDIKEKFELADFTKKQHSLVFQKFDPINYRLSIIDRYAAGRSYISSYPRKSFSFLMEILVLFLDLMRMVRKRILRFFSRKI
jgi:hypothetical protein